jgi:hypothetical protein
MRNTKIKQFFLLLVLLLPAAWCGAKSTLFFDGFSPIVIKESILQGAPKGSTIQASIDGHTLTVVFTENLGQVAIEVTTATGTIVQTYWMNTPDGLQSYMANNGDYIITFTLSNGDEYYGEFTVTD